MVTRLLVIGLTGCVNDAARSAFNQEFDCHEDTQVYSLPDHKTLVEGCGHTEIYVCHSEGGSTLSSSSNQILTPPSHEFQYNLSSGHYDYVPVRSTPSFGSSHVYVPQGRTLCEHEQQIEQVERPDLAPPPQSRNAPSPVPAKIRTEKLRDGDKRLVLELGLDGQSLLTLSGRPHTHPGLLQLRLLRSEVDRNADSCDLRWFVDGHLIEIPAPSINRQNQFLERRQQLADNNVAALATAQRVTLRSCRHRWSLTPVQLERVRDLAARLTVAGPTPPPPPPEPAPTQPAATPPESSESPPSP